MKTIRPVVLVVAALVWAAPAVAGGFLLVYEDLPLPPALTEVPGSALSFDAAEGRIVQADAKGKGDAASVQGFYASALPQLGWTDDGAGRFHRDPEQLKIDVTQSGATVVAHFTISPK